MYQTLNGNPPHSNTWQAEWGGGGCVRWWGGGGVLNVPFSCGGGCVRCSI